MNRKFRRDITCGELANELIENNTSGILNEDVFDLSFYLIGMKNLEEGIENPDFTFDGFLKNVDDAAFWWSSSIFDVDEIDTSSLKNLSKEIENDPCSDGWGDPFFEGLYSCENLIDTIAEKAILNELNEGEELSEKEIEDLKDDLILFIEGFMFEEFRKNWIKEFKPWINIKHKIITDPNEVYTLLNIEDYNLNNL